ncbi:MAG TPA: phosphoglycolate phosphatase [Methanoregulaceae archaeon]|nr:phosphoglycolate phosphatase [Methanoregulaceae archaeon]HQJ87645.1 phosphoglycolate phosphatase [Methanoregulaceae archaeon]
MRAVVTDIDGTITDGARRISLSAIREIRRLVDDGIPVVLASGNTLCFMDSIAKMIGTSGAVIAENGGVWRREYPADPVVEGDRRVTLAAFEDLRRHYAARGVALDLYSHSLRHADVAFARTVPVDEVRRLLASHPVRVLDTGFAIHLQQAGITKATALSALARAMGLEPSDFLAVGDSENDVEMIREAGAGAAVGNAVPGARAAADYVATAPYGDGFVEAVRHFLP